MKLKIDVLGFVHNDKETFLLQRKASATYTEEYRTYLLPCYKVTSEDIYDDLLAKLGEDEFSLWKDEDIIKVVEEANLPSRVTTYNPYIYLFFVLYESIGTPVATSV